MDLKASIAYLLKDEKGMSESALAEIIKSVLGAKTSELKKSLTEMKKKGEIIQEEDLIKATARAKRRIPKTEKIRYALPLWHRRWTMVVFNIPETEKKIRDQLRYQLKKYGFSVWQNSVWVCPHPLHQNLKLYLTNHGLEKKVKVFYGILSSADEKSLINSVWKPQKIEKQYREFIQDTKRKFKRLKNLNNLKAELKEKALDLLAKLTELKYLDIIRKDPRLPRSLLSKNWLGFRAYRIYQQLDKYLK
ncbi:hypothetical protein J7K05_03135 [bacterium]|nr:hypothetical protein [bacterium]